MNDFAETSGLRDYPLARRGMMMMTGLMSGFTLAVGRVVAQTITTDAKGLDVGDTKIPTSEGDLPAYYARPAKGTRFPVVIVNEEIFGVHEHIRCVPQVGEGGVSRDRSRVLRTHRRSFENDGCEGDRHQRDLQDARCPLRRGC